MNVKELAKQMFEFNDNEVARVDMIDVCRFANVIADAEREACEKHYLVILEELKKDEREACAKLCEPQYPRPCDCDVCYCDNRGDAQEVAEWDALTSFAAAIRGRSE